jgi:hypothetical protein
MDGRGHDPMTFKRNLQSLTVLLLILGRSAWLFFRQTRVSDAMLLPVMPFLLFLSSCKISISNKRNKSKALIAFFSGGLTCLLFASLAYSDQPDETKKAEGM